MIKTKNLATLNKYLFVWYFLVLIGIFSKVSNVLDSREKNHFSLKIKWNHIFVTLYNYETNYYDELITALNPLSADPTKWSNTLKQFVVGFSGFDHFLGLALKGLRKKS